MEQCVVNWFTSKTILEEGLYDENNNVGMHIVDGNINFDIWYQPDGNVERFDVSPRHGGVKHRPITMGEIVSITESCTRK